MKIEWSAHSNETPDLLTVLEKVDHIRQSHVGQAIAIICKKYILVFHKLPDSGQSLANVAPNACIDQGYAPIRGTIAKNFNLAAEFRNNTIAVHRRSVVQKIVFDNVGLVAEAKDKISMIVLAVILHDVPQYRL